MKISSVAYLQNYENFCLYVLKLERLPVGRFDLQQAIRGQLRAIKDVERR